MGELQLDAETRQGLEKVSAILSKGELAASDYAGLTEALEQILEVHYPAS